LAQSCKASEVRRVTRKLEHCAICDISDARALAEARVGREKVILCGTHALMHARLGRKAKTLVELKEILRDRRSRARRVEEHDDLAAMLTAAFALERRRTDRRAS
jgi:hypothetical protein